MNNNGNNTGKKSNGLLKRFKHFDIGIILSIKYDLLLLKYVF